MIQKYDMKRKQGQPEKKLLLILLNGISIDSFTVWRYLHTQTHLKSKWNKYQFGWCTFLCIGFIEITIYLSKISNDPHTETIESSQPPFSLFLIASLSLTHTASFYFDTLLPLAYRQQLKTDTFYPKLFTACLDPRVYECFMWPIVRSVGRSVCRIPFFSSFEWIFPFGTNNKPILTSYFIHIINIIYDIECMQSATCLPFQSGGISHKTHRANPIDSSRPRLWCERLEFFMFHVCSCWVLLEWFLFCSFITNDRIGSGYPSLFSFILSILLFSTSSGVCFFFGWDFLSVNFSISLSKHFLFLHICVQALFCCYRGLLLVVFDVHGHHRIYQ